MGRRIIMRCRLLLPIVIAALGVGAAGSLANSDAPQAHWVPTLLHGGKVFAGARAKAINERRQVIGTGISYTRPEQDFFWENGKATDLNGIEAHALNEHGQVVGELGTAVVWEQGRRRYLGSLKLTSDALAVNERGQLVGWTQVRLGSSARHASLWLNGHTTDLGTLGGAWSVATAVNARGQIVGWSETKNGARHAFLWQNGRMRDLGVLPGSKGSEAVAINEHGQVIGDSFTRVDRDGVPGGASEVAPRAFSWYAGRMTRLETPSGSSSVARAINAHGEIVGTVFSEDSHGRVPRAAVWRKGRATFLSMPAGDTISDALALNDHGEIVGWSGVVGAHSAYIWDNNTRTLLPDPGGEGRDAEVTASDITERGDVLGTREAVMATAQAVLWNRSPAR